MSKADQQFVTMCRDILDHGTTTEGQKVRPVWEDGTPAYTIKNFGVTARYDLREEFPALTLRRTALKSAMDEILWIYQKKSNNVHDLNSHIWDEWPMRPVPSVKPTAIRLVRRAITPRATSTRWTVCCTTLSTRRIVAAL